MNSKLIRISSAVKDLMFSKETYVACTVERISFTINNTERMKIEY